MEFDRFISPHSGAQYEYVPVMYIAQRLAYEYEHNMNIEHTSGKE